MRGIVARPCRGQSAWRAWPCRAAACGSVATWFDASHPQPYAGPAFVEHQNHGEEQPVRPVRTRSPASPPRWRFGRAAGLPRRPIRRPSSSATASPTRAASARPWCRPRAVGAPCSASSPPTPALVWSEYLADYYGTNAHPAPTRAAPTTPSAARAPAPTAPARSARSRRSPRRSTPTSPPTAAAPIRNALYTVWGGANDLFAIDRRRAGAAPAIIGGAVGAQIGNVGALTDAGAQYILVPTVPDLGITPQLPRAGRRGVRPAARSWPTTYNNALFSGLASADLRVIPLDTFHLLQRNRRQPGAVWLQQRHRHCVPAAAAPADSSLTCNPGTYVAPDARHGYVFADGVHPEPARRTRSSADYALSVLEAPRQIAVLPHSALDRRPLARRARRRACSRSVRKAKARAGGPTCAATTQRYGDGDHYDGMGPTLSFGIDWASGDAGVRRLRRLWPAGHRLRPQPRRLRADRRHARRLPRLVRRRVLGQCPAELDQVELRRRPRRAARPGRPARTAARRTARTSASAASAGWDFDARHAHARPGGLACSRRASTSTATTRTAPKPTALAFPDQNVDSLIGTAGWQARYANSATLQPYARLTCEHEFEDAPAEAFAQSHSMPGTAPYAVPGIEFDADYGTLHLRRAHAGLRHGRRHRHRAHGRPAGRQRRDDLRQPGGTF